MFVCAFASALVTRVTNECLCVGIMREECVRANSAIGGHTDAATVVDDNVCECTRPRGVKEWSSEVTEESEHFWVTGGGESVITEGAHVSTETSEERL